jgi:hypothetical protein
MDNVNIFELLRAKMADTGLQEIVNGFDQAVKSHYGGVPPLTGMSDQEQMFEMNKFWLKLIIDKCEVTAITSNLRAHLCVESSMELYLDLFMKQPYPELIRLRVFDNVK